MREPIVLRVPDPSLVVLVGAAGAGKSTFAARHFAPDEVLSSDAFRALIAGDSADQRATKAAFGALHRALERRLTAGRLTVVDATSVQPHTRRVLLRRAGAARVPAAAIVLDLPADIVLGRNAARGAGAVVPPEAVLRQLGQLAATVARESMLGWPGFAVVHRLRLPEDVDRAVIVRERAGGPSPAGGVPDRERHRAPA